MLDLIFFVDKIGFSKGKFPINYLDFPIFKGKVKLLQPITNTILAKVLFSQL